MRALTTMRLIKQPYALWFLISILAASCATSEKTVEPPKPTHYVLEEAPVIVASKPYPNQHPIYVKMYAGELLLERRLAYRGFDMDHDGFIDMIEYLDKKGEVIRTSYKFAGDKDIKLPTH
ncbi:MAG: hypothetical protein V4655_05760 [Bdellovibrionota bacterium]|nr:MAG: hypothetical protein EOP10_09740 [Pseudomonadota bacterium]